MHAGRNLKHFLDVRHISPRVLYPQPIGGILINVLLEESGIVVLHIDALLAESFLNHLCADCATHCVVLCVAIIRRCRSPHTAPIPLHDDEQIIEEELEVLHRISTAKALSRSLLHLPTTVFQKNLTSLSTRHISTSSAGCAATLLLSRPPNNSWEKQSGSSDLRSALRSACHPRYDAPPRRHYPLWHRLQQCLEGAVHVPLLPIVPPPLPPSRPCRCR
mmetsp:Transcript_39287/g.99556  ORF Transcript_39287/g.99556 Transcript_39287/m.99556 type:complete len:219 (+) Transcript_39287:868-1524(+)